MNQPAGRATYSQSKARYSWSICRKTSPYKQMGRTVHNMIISKPYRLPLYPLFALGSDGCWHPKHPKRDQGLHVCGPIFSVDLSHTLRLGRMMNWTFEWRDRTFIVAEEEAYA